jgi:hypothetical protein
MLIMMIRVLAALTVAAGFTVFAPVDAEAAWVCNAKSRSAWGTGWHTNSRRYAVRRALAECAIRTPRGQVCRIISCE